MSDLAQTSHTSPKHSSDEWPTPGESGKKRQTPVTGARASERAAAPQARGQSLSMEGPSTGKRKRSPDLLRDLIERADIYDAEVFERSARTWLETKGIGIRAVLRDDSSLETLVQVIIRDATATQQQEAILRAALEEASQVERECHRNWLQRRLAMEDAAHAEETEAAMPAAVEVVEAEEAEEAEEAVEEANATVQAERMVVAAEAAAEELAAVDKIAGENAAEEQAGRAQDLAAVSDVLSEEEEEEKEEEEDDDERLALVPAAQQLVRSPELPGADRITLVLHRLESPGYAAAVHPDGMPVQLYDVQLQSLQWMRDQETDPGRELSSLFFARRPAGDVRPEEWRCLLTGATRGSKPPAESGGMLCDDMGLGKTLVMAALVLSNPFDAQLVQRRRQDHQFPEVAVRASLMVVPVRLLPQWRAELRKAGFAEHDIYEHHHKERRTTLEACVASAAVVLTTPERLKDDGRLGKVLWWRTAFDESGQAAFGQDSATLATARSLHAVHRWVMTGTPLRKTIESLCGQLSVLRIEPVDADHRQWWSIAIQRLASADVQTLLPLLRKLIIRHSKQQTYVASGARVIELPPKAVEYVGVDFEPGSSHEVVYCALEHLARLEQLACVFGKEGREHKLLHGFPAQRVQELLLAATHSCAVELGTVAARIPVLQTTAARSAHQLPTRLCTLDEVLECITLECAEKLGFSASAQGLESLRARVRSDHECCLCAGDLSSEDCARIVVPGCFHSYCSRCLTDRFSRNDTIYCSHRDCVERQRSRSRADSLRDDHHRQGTVGMVQVGNLKEVGSPGAVLERERHLDPSERWHELDKQLPEPAGTPESPLTALTVQCCDSQLSDASGSTSAYNRRYVHANNCADGHMDVRHLDHSLVKLPPCEGVLSGECVRPVQAPSGGEPSGDVCPICLDVPREPVHLRCTHVFCRGCVTELLNASDRDGRQDARCPQCRDAFVVAQPLLSFCEKSCAIKAFSYRLQKRPINRAATRAVCAWCRDPLNSHCHECIWLKRGDNVFAGLRFHSVGCAKSWFEAHLHLRSAEDIGKGNRSLYALGENVRDITEYSPLLRGQGTTYFAMEREWNSVPRAAQTNAFCTQQLCTQQPFTQQPCTQQPCTRVRAYPLIMASCTSQSMCSSFRGCHVARLWPTWTRRVAGVCTGCRTRL